MKQESPPLVGGVVQVSGSDIGMVIADMLANVVVKLELCERRDVYVKFAENMGHYIEEIKEDLKYDKDLLTGMECFRRYALKQIG